MDWITFLNVMVEDEKAAIAKYRIAMEHAKGRRFKVRVLTGASSGYSIDEVLAKAGAIDWRGPYQADGALRKQINRQEVEYVDMLLSHLPQAVAEEEKTRHWGDCRL